MAELDLAVQQVIAPAGLEPVYGSLATGNNYHVPNDGRTFIHFKKSGAGACTVTFVTPGTVRGLAISDPTATVDALTGDTMVGPFPTDLYNDAEREVVFSVSEATGLTAAVLRV